jgi:predicted RNA binding protein YcfA (HicA-like mRNA interferase family)
MPKLSPVSYRLLCCVFEKAGFQQMRQEGSHVVYTKPGVSRPIVIPTYRSIPVFVIKNNLRSAGLTRDRYFELLALCR